MNIETSFHKRKRESLQKSLQSNEIAIITSSYPVWRTADQFYPFRQDSNFYYLTGLNSLTPSMLILFPQSYLGSTEWLLIPRTDKEKIKWDGGEIPDDQISISSGIEKVMYWDEFETKFGRGFSSKSKVLLNIPELDFRFVHHPSKEIREQIQKSFPLISFGSILPNLTKLRMIKEAVEISKTKKAIEVTGLGIEKMKSVSASIHFEYELEAEFRSELLKNGILELGYEPIIASGKNATILHYRDNNQKIGNNDLILTDVGGEFEGYSADVTRVFPKVAPTQRQHEIYAAVLEVNRKLIELVKPGIVYQTLNDFAKELLTESAIKLKLISKPDEINKVYMHRVSHFLGLDVHDSGSYDQILEPGMLITIEPGLYSENEKIGIRIEDDVLITENGCEVLTKNIGKNL